MRELSRSEIIAKRKEIEHFLKTDTDIPTGRYLAAKDAELYEELERLETQGIAAIIQVIERAAMNPNVDIDKMERLLEM